MSYHLHRRAVLTAAFADETRCRGRPNNAGRMGATISTNEAGGLKAFYCEAARPPREQSVLLTWLPGTPGRKGSEDRKRGGGLGEAWREREEGRQSQGWKQKGLCCLDRLLPSLSPLQKPRI